MHTWLLKTATGVHTGGEELFDVWKSQPGSLLWLDIEGVGSDSDRDMLEQKFGLAEADVEDAFRVRHPPAFEGEGERLFLLLKLLDADSHTLDFSTQQMAMFADSDFVITRHDSRSNYLLMLREKIRNGGMDFESPHQVVAGLARRMVDRYGKVLLDVEDRLDTVEDVLFVELDEGLMQELVGYNTALRKMRRILNYHMAVTQRLSTYAEGQQLGEWVEEYENVATQAERFNSLAELYQNVIKIHEAAQAAMEIEADHRRQFVADALGRVSPKAREILALRYWVELPLEEISTTLGIGLSATKMRLHRAHRQCLDVMDLESGLVA